MTGFTQLHLVQLDAGEEVQQSLLRSSSTVVYLQMQEFSACVLFTVECDADMPPHVLIWQSSRNTATMLTGAGTTAAVHASS